MELISACFWVCLVSFSTFVWYKYGVGPGALPTENYNISRGKPYISVYGIPGRKVEKAQPTMSNTAKITVTIVVILVVLGGIYWWLMGQYGAPAPSGTSVNQPGAASQLTSGNTNTDLNQDLATIDSQMNGFTSDSASMNQSLSDQPVSQTQL
jgi:hypothetical protein